MTEEASRATSVTHVDIHVGKMIRAIRKAKGVSQEKLADAIAVTFQQVQKYERGFNRISASKMYDTSRALGVSPSAFFEGLEGSDGEGLPPTWADFLAEDGADEVAAGYVRLTTTQQRAIAALISSMVLEAPLTERLSRQN